MRIAMLSDDWWPVTGGGPAHVEALALTLAEEFGDRVDVLTRRLRDGDDEYRETEEYLDGQVRVHRLGPCTEYWNPVGRAASLASPVPKLLADDYDVVHGHAYLPAVPLRVADALTDAGSVFTVHGMPLTSGGDGSDAAKGGSADGADDPGGVADRLRERAVEALVLDFEYDAVVSVNRSNVDALEAAHDRVAYVPNGVDTDRFRPDLAPTERKVLYLGRLDPQKRVGDLIDAFDAVADEFPDRELVIVGTGRIEDELRARAADSASADRIRFTGKVSDEEVARQYASAETFVLPSHWEGHPLALLEAWASGLPVVASDVTGVREFVDHRENGYLVEPGDPDALADGLRHVLSNPETASAWGRRGRELVEREYGWTRCAERTRRIYREVTR